MPSPSPKRQRWTSGAVVIVPLGDEFHSYAQMLERPEYAFFEIRTKDDLSADDIVMTPVAFRLWVMRYAHGSGRWTKIGTARICDALRKPVLRFNQDPLRPDNIRLTYDGFSGPVGSFEDCDNLECAAVWDPEHVEDRLRDHFAGVANKWAISLRPKRVK